MIGYVVFDQASRIVLRAGTCPRSQLNLQPGIGEVARWCAADTPLVRYTDGETLVDDITGVLWRAADDNDEETNP